MQALLRFTKTQSFQKSLLDGMRNWFNWFYAVTTNLIGQYLTSDGLVVCLSPVPPPRPPISMLGALFLNFVFGFRRRMDPTTLKFGGRGGRARAAV
jgi:hypothetical protein